eukprot:3908880-Amphidinium_carterae.1
MQSSNRQQSDRVKLDISDPFDSEALWSANNSEKLLGPLENGAQNRMLFLDCMSFGSKLPESGDRSQMQAFASGSSDEQVNGASEATSEQQSVQCETRLICKHGMPLRAGNARNILGHAYTLRSLMCTEYYCSTKK